MDETLRWLPLTDVAAHPGLSTRPFAQRDGLLLTRAEFLAGVAAWQARLAPTPGPRWALYTEDSADFAMMLFGAWHAGKTVVLPGDRQAATLARLATAADGALGDLPDAWSMRAGAEEPAAPPQPPRTLRPLDAHTTGLIVYTSGSSGEPTAINKTLAQLDAEMHTLQSAFGDLLDGVEPPLSVATVSHQHIYGLLFQVLWPLAAGRPFLARRLDYLEALPGALGGRPGVLVASPAHLRRIPDDVALAAAGPLLRAVFSSGGPLPPDAAADTQARLAHSPIEVFGSSETGGIAWRQRAHDGDHWRTLPGVAWRIADELLEVRSAHLPDGAWFTTADRVQALPGGARFTLRGRADRIVKVGEKRVSLTTIEHALLGVDRLAVDLPGVGQPGVGQPGVELPGVELPALELHGVGLLAEARALLLPGAAGHDDRIAVVGVASPAGAQLLQAEGRRAFSERLRTRLLAHVERVALPRRWRFVEVLPTNPQGKVTEAALVGLFTPPAEPGGRPAAQWREKADQRAVLLTVPTADLAVFDGHFPGRPVLPGVAQLDWAIAWGREAFPTLPPRFLRIDALKFHQAVPPGTLLELTLEWSRARQALAFRYASDAGTHASGRVVFAEDGAADA